MSALQRRTQEISAEYWAGREATDPRLHMTERLAVAQLCFYLARVEAELAECRAERLGEPAPTPEPAP